MLINRFEFPIDDYLENAEKSQFWFFDRRLSTPAENMEGFDPHDRAVTMGLTKRPTKRYHKLIPASPNILES